MTTAEDVLTHARKYLNVTEAPPGSNLNPFAALAGHPNGYAWCASFVVAVFRELGIKLPSESAWTPSMAQGFQQAGQWHAGAEGAGSGDVLFWDFPDATHVIEHVSICAAPPAGGQITDIGGNTSSGPGGSEDNGGGVFERTRTTAWVVGYGRPPYAQSAPTSQPAPAVAPPPAAPRAMIRVGSRGPDVVHLQQKLHLSADGIFGPQTERAVRLFQQQHGLGADGIVGPRTWAAVG